MYDIKRKIGNVIEMEGVVIGMKKVLICFFILVCVFSFTSVFATTENAISSDTGSQLVQMKDKEHKELQDYIESYGSDTYGLTAYILGKVRIYSIPLCFIGIAVGAIFQYVIGVRKLDVRDRGLVLIIGFVTVLVICQVLPLIFAIIVKGWRS